MVSEKIHLQPHLPNTTVYEIPAQNNVREEHLFTVAGPVHSRTVECLNASNPSQRDSNLLSAIVNVVASIGYNTYNALGQLTSSIHPISGNGASAASC